MFTPPGFLILMALAPFALSGRSTPVCPGASRIGIQSDSAAFPGLRPRRDVEEQNHKDRFGNFSDEDAIERTSNASASGKSAENPGRVPERQRANQPRSSEYLLADLITGFRWHYLDYPV